LPIEKKFFMSISGASILLFKTNIKTPSSAISQLLDGHPYIHHWSLDTEDVDCVLKVVSHTLSSQQIINDVEALGYSCSEFE
jgi:hypothetical protein